MKREIFDIRHNVSGCCPGHDDYPDDVYGNRRSTKARAKGIKREHKYVRTVVNRELKKEVEKVQEPE